MLYPDAKAGAKIAEMHDASSCQNMPEDIDRLEAVEAIREGLKDVEEGRVHGAREALEALRSKRGLR